MDLFDNPMVKKALESMSSEQREEYQKMGENMFGSVNFTDSKILNNLPPPVEEAIIYIEKGIEAGLLPEDMEESEISTLSNAFGPKWYKRYGFLESQIPKTDVTIPLEAFSGLSEMKKTAKKN